MKKIIGLILALCLALCAFSTLADVTVDRAGSPITLPEKVETILSMGPSTTEVLIALGAGDKLVGVDTYAFDVEGLPENLPAFDMMAPDIEKIAELKPDVLIATGMTFVGGENPFQPLVDLGICVVCIPSSETLADIQKDILFIGEVAGKTTEAEALTAQMQETFDRIATIGKTVETPKNVYFEISAAPYLYSFGTGTFLNEMIEMIGAKNVMADQTSWVSLSEEAVLAKNPDVILTNVSYVDNAVEEIMGRAAWDTLTAVKNKEVFFVDTNASSRPSHRVVIALEEIAKAVYPELYK